MAEQESVYLFSTTALTNGTADPAINFAEGQLPGTMNNSARGLMAAIARYVKDTDGSLTTAGSANAYTLTINGRQTPLATGHILTFKASFANTGTATLAVTNADAVALGAKAIRAPGDVALISGQMISGGVYTCRYDTAANSAAGAWILLNPNNANVAEMAALADQNAVANGAMTVSQEFGSNAVTITGTGAVQHTSTLDQWYVGYSGAMIATIQQVADAPAVAGLVSSLKMAISTADASMAAGDVFSIGQAIEGYEFAKFGFGTSAALPITLTIWVKAHRIGTYSGTLKNASGALSFLFNITVNVADTWERKTIAITAQTTGTWPTDSAAGAYLQFTVASGSTLLGAAAGWQSGNFDGITGTINGVAATSDTFQFTGVSMLPGTQVIPDADTGRLIISFSKQLPRCMRFWEATYDHGVVPGTVTRVGDEFIGAAGPTLTVLGSSTRFKVQKRSDPSMIFYSPNSGTTGKAFDVAGAADQTCAVRDTAGMNGFAWVVSGFSSANAQMAVHWTANSRLVG